MSTSSAVQYLNCEQITCGEQKKQRARISRELRERRINRTLFGVEYHIVVIFLEIIFF